MSLPFANKKLGQHFLRDKNVISKITQDFCEHADAIIEVGPGPGILTKALAQHNKPFHIVEKDTRFIEQLGDILSPEQITFTDALTVNWEELIKEKFPQKEKIWLVSNLPYNISVPLLISFLKSPSFKYLTLMFQKEVGDKFLDKNLKNQMNSLLALSNCYFATNALIKVSPGAFVPPPKVDSIVVSFKRLENPLVPIEEIDNLEKFLQKLFAFKRKQLGTVLKSFIAKDKIAAILESAAISTDIRAEKLQLEEIIKLYRASREHI